MINDGYVSQCKEDFGEAYVNAVAATAGCWIDWLRRDYDGIDGQISRYGNQGSFPDAPLRFQLKTTHAAAEGEGELRFRLPIKNYNKLRVRRGASAILIVVVVPADPAAWLVQDEMQLSLVRAGYWLSLENAPEVTASHTTTVRIPNTQLFSVDSLDDMMDRVVEDRFP